MMVDNLFSNSIVPSTELYAYEMLWLEDKASFRTLAELFKSNPNATPSFFIKNDLLGINAELKNKVANYIDSIREKTNFNILLNTTLDYPKKLRDANCPIELLYFIGDIDLINTNSIAIVGTRTPSLEGLKRANKLVKLLVKDGFTIVSGLAKGIDSIVHKTAIEEGGKTIAVIGTPVNEFYPKENKELQLEIAKKHLLISQIPFYRYSLQNPTSNKFFFPERNKTMSAITEATIIVEAGETSGTLVQARAALQQGRKLFILNSCFENPKLKWPHVFLEKGAIRVKEYSDILNILKLID